MKKNLLILALLVSVLPAEAQRFVPKNVSDGLGNRKAYQLAQDADGYIWIYTQGSIDRYDGFEFRHYILPPEATQGRFLATANTLCLDRDGVLNVVQTNGRIYRYRREADAMELAATLADGYLYCVLYADSGSWAGTSKGLVSLPEGKTLLPGRTVFCLEGSSERLYAGTDAGVFSVGPEGNEPLPGIPAGEITALKLLEDGRLYIGTFADGAFCHNPRTGKSQALPGFPHVPVRKIVREKGNLLFGTDGAGIVVYDSFTETITATLQAADKEGSLCANTVSDLLLDRDQVLWVSTTTDGICYRDANRLSPEWIRHNPGDSPSLVSNHVNSIWEDSRSRLWFATNQGISRLDGGQWHSFDAPSGSNVVLTLAEDEDGTLWAGGYGHPVFSIDRHDRVRPLDNASFQYVFSMAVQGKQLWIGDLNQPLTARSLSDGEVLSFQEPSVWDLYPDGESMWVASHTGLGQADGGRIRWLDFPEGAAGAWCIARDGNGDIWAGLENGGILRYRPSDGSMRVIPLEGTVFAILPCRDGSIWAVNGEDLFRLAPEADKPVVMNRFLGMGPGEFNHTAARRLRDGRFLFGTANGALLFHPDQLDRRPMGTITPVLTQFHLPSGKAEEILKGKSVNTFQRLVLPASARSFSLGFSALNLHAQARVSFRYQLKGEDRQPRESLSATMVEYTGLRPGKYLFEVTALDTLTGAELGTRSLPIRIRKPLWLTPWAFLLYALLLGLFLYQLRLLQRRKKEARMARERIENFTSFAHDIKTPLTLIKAPLSDMELQETLSSESRESLKVARKNADKLMSMLNELLQLREFESGEDVLEVSPCTLDSYIEEQLDDYYLSAQSKGISLEQDTAKGPHTVFTDVRKMDMILGNLLSNALKYTEKGAITVRTAAEGNRWTLTVQDTGIGIPEEARGRIFKDAFRADNARSADNTGYGIGLLITRQLVHSLRGSIRYEAGPDGGSCFILSFPQHYKPGKQVQVKEAVKEEDLPAPPTLRKPEEDIPATLLLVEDDPETLQYLSSALGQQYTILMADNGQSAYELALEKNPDLIVTDLVMPRLTGDELCRRIKGAVETSHIPVILLTAMGEKESIILGLEAGADDYIVKPFDMAVLRARIRNLFKQRSQLQAAIVMDKVEEEGAEFGNELDRRFMKKVQAVVGAHLSDADFQVADLCKEMAMSRSSFFNKLKSLTGVGPNDYIRIFRLNRAHELLLQHTQSIAEVADAVGFSDAKYFSVCFKKQFGVSPSRV